MCDKGFYDTDISVCCDTTAETCADNIFASAGGIRSACRKNQHVEKSKHETKVNNLKNTFDVNNLQIRTYIEEWNTKSLRVKELLESLIPEAEKALGESYKRCKKSCPASLSHLCEKK